MADLLKEEAEWLSFVESLERKPVRDLAWCLCSPSMVTSELFPQPLVLQQRGAIRAWLHSVEEEPESLLSFLKGRRSRRLGFYYEALWLYFLHNYEGVEVLAEGLQVFQGKQTVGEFDVIYRTCEDRVVRHLELAVKYYLGIPGEVFLEPSPWFQWLGPSTWDRLDRKLERLLTHQTQLSGKAEGKAALESLGITTVVPEMWVGGALFAPWQGERLGECSRFSWPKDTNHSMVRGFWTHVDSFVGQVAKFPLSWRWVVLSRLEWLASPPGWVVSKAFDGAEPQADFLQRLREALEEGEQPVQCMALAPRESGWGEAARWFVAPVGWPEPAKNPNLPRASK